MTLQQILGMEKKEEEICNHGLGRPDGWNNWRREGYNLAVEELSAWRFDREKLINVIKKDFESTSFNAKTIPESIADAILDNLKGVLVKND